MSTAYAVLPIFAPSPTPARSAPAAVPHTASRSAPHPDPADDPIAALVPAAQDKDPFAINALIGHLRPLIVRYCRARIGTSASTFASADDVAQDVCLAVLSALPSYRSTGASFRSFVYGIATHKIMDFHRKCGREKSLPMYDLPDTHDQSAGPEGTMLQSETSEQLKYLLGALSPVQREVLTLRLIVGYSVAETARMVSASPGAVRVCQHRALSKLRRLIASSTEQEPAAYFADDA